MQPFVHLSIVFWLYTALQYRSSSSSNFLVYHTSSDISLRPVAFLFLILFSTTLSSWVNSPNFMSCWLLIIFVIGLFVTLDFPNIYLKCSFHRCIRSWLVAFSLALEVLFFLLTSFTVCHAIRECLSFLSSTGFLILLIWPWIYSIFSF